MTRHSLFMACALLAVAAGAGAQGLLTERGFNGIGASSGVLLGVGGFRGATVSAGYSISGILDVGVRIAVVPTALAGSSAVDLGVSALFDVVALKQSPSFPLSVQLTSAYGLVTTDSSYLDLNHLTRRASEFAFGLVISSNIYFARAVGIQVGAVGEYSSRTITIDSQGTGVTGYPRTERQQTLQVGGELGLLLRTRTETVYRVGLRVLLDTSLELTFVPTVAVAARGM